MIKNLIFDIGGVIIKEVEAKAFDHLSEREQEELNKIVFYNKRFQELAVGNITSEEYKNELIKENKKYEKEIQDLLDMNKQNIFIPKDEKMIRLLYRIKDKYNIYFLSNMIDITYDYLYDFLNDFNGGAYSFIERDRKPNENFYLKLIERYNLNQSECVFFDDRLKNVLVARELGMQAIEFKSIQDVLNIIEESNL